MSNNDFIVNYYYLLYKIKNNSTLWIVDEDYNKKILLNRIKEVSSSRKETYFVVKKRYMQSKLENMIDDKFKQFRQFKIDRFCTIIYKT